MKSKHTSSNKAFIPYNNPFSKLEEPVDTSMDWSEDTPIQTSSSPCAPLTENHVSLPHVLLSHSTEGNNVTDSNNQNTSGLGISVLNYSNN